MREKVLEIMASMLEVEPASLQGNPDRDSVANWDSLRHMSLILALEEEFGLQFKEQQIFELNSLDAILTALSAQHH